MAERRTPTGRTPAPRAGARPAPRGPSRPPGRAAAAKRPAAKAPAAKAPAAKRPATTRAPAKATAARRPTPAAKRPATKRPAAKRPAAKRPATKRPAAKRPANRADRTRRSALGRVDGTTDARRARGRSRRRMVGGLVVTVLLVGVLFIAVFPTRSYLAQRTATARSEAELREVQEERARLQAEREELLTDEAVEQQVRENGWVKEGEEPYRALPTAVEPIGLPPGWPFTGVERALGAP